MIKRHFEHILQVFLCAILFSFVTAHNVQAQTPMPNYVKPFIFPRAGATGGGGNHVALVDDFSTIFNNPAGFASVKKQFNASIISLDVKDINIMGTILFSEDRITEMMNLLGSVLQTGLELNVDIGGPIAIGRVGNNWGIGLFNVSRLNLIWNTSDIFKVSPSVTEELMLQGGYGLRLINGKYNKLDLGLMLKGFIRVGYFGLPVYINEVRYFLDNIKTWQFQTELGLGFDAGIRWTIADSFSIAAVCYDAFSPTLVTQYSNIDKFFQAQMIEDKWLPVIPRASAGFSWKIRTDFLARYINHIIISADFHGLLGHLAPMPRNPILDIGAGIEIVTHNIVTFRGGWFEMLPSGGISLNLTVLTMEISYYGKEQGRTPGAMPTYCLSFDLIFRY